MMSLGYRSTTKAIKVIIIVTLCVYLFQILPFTSRLLIQWGALVPWYTFRHFQLWRLVTYVFLHAPSYPFHILFNMLMLWMFGAEIEERWGTKRFAIFYLICGAGSGFFSLINLFNGDLRFTPVIGASGAVLGVLTVYALYFPYRQVLLFFILPINIRIVVIGYAIISLFGVLSPGGIVSHLTHLGGIIIALAYIKLYPRISSITEDILKTFSERNNRKRVKEELDRKNYFENTIDPILDKIGRQGIQSLNDSEKKILKKMKKNEREQMKKRKIIPFDPFKRK